MPCVLVADDTTEFAEMLRATLEEAGLRGGHRLLGAGGLSGDGNP